MAGRTERVNAKDLLDRADGIFFEGDVARNWLEQLIKRATGTLEAASKNRYFEDEWKPEYEEIGTALQALKDATTQLEIFKEAVARREGKAPPLPRIEGMEGIEMGSAASAAAADSLDFEDIEESEEAPAAPAAEAEPAPVAESVAS